MIKYVMLFAGFILLTACSVASHSGEVKTVVVRETINELEKEPVPGTVNEVWTEPMFDTVRVPASLDPDGVYYRPSHETVVIIRPGKYQKVEYPDYNGTYRKPH